MHDERNTTNEPNSESNSVVADHYPLRFGAHRRCPVSAYLPVDLYEWLRIEARVHRVTLSEQVQRILRQQQNLRKELAALSEPQPDAAPVFQVLLERHGEKVSQTMDNAAKQLAVMQTALDLLKTMVAHGARIGLTAKQFSQWEQAVQNTMTGGRTA